MRFFAKLLIAALVLAVLLPFTVIKGKDGRPLMNFSDLKMPDLGLPDLPEGVDMPAVDLPAGDSGQDIVYKWRDAEGNLHFTSQPPPEGIEYETKGYDPQANLIQSVKPEPKQEKESASAEPSDTSQVNKNSDIGNPYSPEKVEKLYKDAQNVQKLLNERFKQQEAIIGQ